MRKHGSIENGAVRQHPHHQGERPSESTGSRFHRIGGHGTLGIALHEVSVHTLRIGSNLLGDLSPRGQHLGNRSLGLGGRCCCDGLAGDRVGHAQNRSAHEADHGQAQSHINKIGFCRHNYFLPYLRWWNLILMSGTAVFISRIAKDMPSG